MKKGLTSRLSLAVLLLLFLSSVLGQNLVPLTSSTQWQAYGTGYTIDSTVQRRAGVNTLRLNNAAATGTAGAFAVVSLAQTTAQALTVSCWSRASAVSGTTNIDFSIYIDSYYTDGTALYGYNLPIAVGTHDFLFVNGTLTPSKPIRELRYYMLLRTSHSGTAWFDDCELFYPAAPPPPPPPPPPPSGDNLVPLTSSTAWRAFGTGYTIDSTVQRTAGVNTLRLTKSTSSATAGAFTIVTLAQTTAQSLSVSCWSRAASVAGTANSDYSIYIDVTYTDNTFLYGYNLPIATGTHDFVQVSGTLVPTKPVRELRYYMLLRGTHTGTAWFDGCILAYPSSPPPPPPPPPPPSGTYPAIANLVVPNPPSGTVQVTYVLQDDQSRATNVAVQVCLDGSSTCRTAATTGSLTGLSTSLDGVTHSFQWNARRDLGFHARTAVLRLVPSNAGATGPATTASLTVPYEENLRARLAVVNKYMIDYGVWDDARVAFGKNYELVILHPTQSRTTINRSLVRSLQLGNDPLDPADDVIVLGYITIGEDDRTVGVSASVLASDARFRGNGNGPRIDPRGLAGSGTSLDGIDPLGLPSNGGTGYASYYLDDNSVYLNNGVGDGVPDRNSQFGGCFINAGDPAWFAAVNNFQLDGVDNSIGLRELMTTTYGRGLGADGIFMDTFDTPAPNAFTNRNSPVVSKFEWTAPGFQAFTQRIRAAFTDKIILQNRGLFFFDPRYPHYKYTTRANIDLAFFESFRLNSNNNPNIDAYAYAENIYITAPRANAEARRPDGFRILSLGYGGGVGAPLTTLTGSTTTGLATFLEDIRVTQDLNGFRHYITNAAVAYLNNFVRDNSDYTTDSVAPVWSSSYNDNLAGTNPGPPTPRVGIQQIVTSNPGSVIVRWDVALDKFPVSYRLYYQTTPFDFTNNPNLSGASRLDLLPISRVGAGYVNNVGPTVYPYEATVGGLQSGTRYYFCIRAYDASPSGSNEEKNTVSRNILAP